MVLLLSMISRFLVLIILFYQKYISIFFSSCCRFHPTCSRYAIDVLRYFGLIRGLFLIARRILRCNPFCSGGLDGIFTKTKNKREY